MHLSPHGPQPMEDARLIVQARPEAGGLKAEVRSVLSGSTKFRDQTLLGSLRGVALRGCSEIFPLKEKTGCCCWHNVL